MKITDADRKYILNEHQRISEWKLTESPEMNQLVTQWDSLPQIKRGELAGYAVGKLGADILLPGGLAKVTLKSVKSAQELAVICKNLQIAQKTLVLETAARIGNSAKIAKVVIDSPEWAKIMNLAKDVLKAFNFSEK